jgi:type IV pilus assembly protein PilM
MSEKRHLPRLPQIACEVSAHGVAAVRAEGRPPRMAATHSRALAPGVLTPALNAQNVQDPQALAAAIEQALAAVGGRGQEIIAVLPDLAVRVTLLDFDSLPERAQEADATVRFRMRKSLPFDIDKAVLSFEVQPAAQGVRVVANIILQSVLEEYESAFRAAGCSPGVVLPSSLATLGAVNESRPTMLLKLGDEASSLAVVQDDRLLFYRLLEGYSGTPTAKAIADEIYPSLVYFQDTFGSPVEKLLVSGVAELAAIARELEELSGAQVRELMDSSVAALPLRNDFAGAVGALL